MQTGAAELYDIFSGEWTREKAEQALEAFRRLARIGVKSEVVERIEDRVEVQVEKTVLREAKDLATKGDIASVREELSGRMDKLESKMQSQFYWLMGGIFTTILAVVGLVVALLSTWPPKG